MLVNLPDNWIDEWAKYAMKELEGRETMDNKYNSLREFVKQWEVSNE